ncbi:MAG: hypothetical protein LBG19_05215 [Prevotellaceae bacterium]|nr:hypothetical protein [Prevotellaceae bacterium]
MRAKQACKLVVVPVNGSGADAKSLERELNKLYNPVGVTWSVTVKDSFEYNGSAAFREKGGGLLSAYTSAMKELQAAYINANNDIDGKAAYLFYINGDNGADDAGRDATAFMPRNKQFAYVFSEYHPNLTASARTVAHELGYGMFALKHTFDSDYKIAQNATDNLMDYTTGATHIAKWQWDQIYDPGVVLRVFEKDEDAMINYRSFRVVFDNQVIRYEELQNLGILDGGDVHFLSPSGQLYTVPLKNPTSGIGLISFSYTGNWRDNSGKILDEVVSNGGVNTIVVEENGKEKVYYGRVQTQINNGSTSNGITFHGYFDSEGNKLKNNAKQSGSVNVLIGLPNDNCQVDLYHATINAADHTFTNEKYNSELGVGIQGKTKLASIQICNFQSPLTLREFYNRAGHYIDRTGNGCTIKLNSGRYMYITIGAEGEALWFEWDTTTYTWKRTYPKEDFAKENSLLDYLTLKDFAQLFLFAAKEGGHGVLDLVGFIPLVGEVADAVNGVWYYLEGEEGEAYLCFASAALPVAGDFIAKGSKWAIKVVKSTKSGEFVITIVSENFNKIKDITESAWRGLANFSAEIKNSFKNFDEIFGSMYNAAIKHLPADKVDELFRLLGGMDATTANKLMIIFERSPTKMANIVAKIGPDDFVKALNKFGKEEGIKAFDVLDNIKHSDELVDAWKLLLNENRIKLVGEIDNVRVFERVSRNEKLVELGISPSDLAKIQGYAGSSFLQILTNVEGFANAVRNNNILLEGFEYIIKDLKGSSSFVDGASWTIKYITDHANNFENSILKFEDILRVGENVRRVDMVDQTLAGRKIFYEFKSVQIVPPGHFSEQFMKDLLNDEVQSIST